MVIKTVRHVVDENGEDVVVYGRTITEQVTHSEGTLSDHIDSWLASVIGECFHGIRYNVEGNAIEYFNPDTEEWEPIIIPDPSVITNE